MISKDCENCDCLEENKQLKQRVNLLSDEISAQGIVIEGYQDRNQKLFDENEQLKQQKDKWKQQCIHFKEKLDGMDIAYLCDEWIYEELKGDVE